MYNKINKIKTKTHYNNTYQVTIFWGNFFSRSFILERMHLKHITGFITGISFMPNFFKTLTETHQIALVKKTLNIYVTFPSAPTQPSRNAWRNIP